MFIASHCPFTWSTIIIIIAFLTTESSASQNVTLQITSPQIVYSPFNCGSMNSTPCAGGWQFLDSDAGSIVSSSGPDPLTGNIIPQMFVNFRASAIYLWTSPSSNATANVSVSMKPSLSAINVQLNSTLGGAAVFNLDENDISSLAITFIPGDSFSLLGIVNITLTVRDASSTSSFLPSQSPPSSTPLTFSLQTSTSTSSSSSSTATSSKSNHVSGKQIGEAFALVLGLGFGLSPIAAVAIFIWKRKAQYP